MEIPVRIGPIRDQAAVPDVPVALDHRSLDREDAVARIGPERLQRGDRSGVMVGPRPRQRPVEADPLVIASVDQLAHADIGAEQVRALDRHRQADRGPVAQAQYIYLPLTVAPTQQLDQFDRIVAVALRRQGRRNPCRIFQQVRAAGGPLIPLHDGEEILPRALEAPGDRHLGRRRTAVDEQQDRIGAVHASHVDDLPRATERRHKGLVHAVRRHDLLNAGDDAASGRVVVGRRRLRDRRRADADQGAAECDDAGGGHDEYVSEVEPVRRAPAVLRQSIVGLPARRVPQGSQSFSVRAAASKASHDRLARLPPTLHRRTPSFANAAIVPL